MIDRLECEQNMANPHIPANRALRYTQIYDAILHAHISLEHRYIPWKSLVWTRVVTDTLLPPALPLTIQNASFFSSLAEVSSAILHLVSKIIVNYRRQCRTVSVIIRKLLVRRTTFKSTKSKKRKLVQFGDDVLVIMKSVLLCALLGNYSQDVQIRPRSLLVRQYLYELFTSDRYDPWVVRLLEHCPSVLTFCVRKYMIYSLEHNPAMLNLIRESIHYNEYKKIVEAGMSKICLLFTEMILLNAHTHNK